MAENDIAFSKWPEMTLTQNDPILILDYIFFKLLLRFKMLIIKWIDIVFASKNISLCIFENSF